MEYLVISFRSRAETVSFNRFLNNNGINAEIVNTPKQAGVGCGLSVKTGFGLLPVIKRAVIAFSPKSLAGFFAVKKTSDGFFVKSV